MNRARSTKRKEGNKKIQSQRISALGAPGTRTIQKQKKESLEESHKKANDGARV